MAKLFRKASPLYNLICTRLFCIGHQFLPFDGQSELVPDGDQDYFTFQDATDGVHKRVLGMHAAASGHTRSAASLTINSSASAETLFSTTITGGTLSSNRCLHFFAYGTYLNSSGSGSTLTVTVSYGLTDIMANQSGSITSDGDLRAWLLHVMLSGNNATNAQAASMSFTLGPAVAALAGVGSFLTANQIDAVMTGTAAEDSTGDLTFAVTVQHSISDANTSLVAQYRRLRLV